MTTPLKISVGRYICDDNCAAMVYHRIQPPFSQNVFLRLCTVI